MRNIYIICLILTCGKAGAQVTRPDTIGRLPRLDINQTGFCLRVATGVQGSFYYEAGLAYTTFKGSPHGIFGANLYAAFASFPSFNRQQTTANGIRLGAEIYGAFTFFGIVLSSFRTTTQHELLIGPKIGLGIPALSGFYAYHFSNNNYAIGKIGKHEAGLQVSPDIWGKDRLKGTTRWFWMSRRRVK